MDPVVPEWYVTFGVQYEDEPHPLGMHPAGFAVIEAPDYDMAHRIAGAIFGTAWAFLYDVDDFIHDGTAARWHPRGELLRIAWQPASAWPTKEDQ